MSRPVSPFWIVSLGLAFLVAGCPGEPSTDRSEPVVVTTVVPLSLIARELAAPDARVSSLLPAGASPHTFEPLPSDLARLSGADLCLRLGPGSDDWVARLLDAAPADLGVMSILDIDGLDLRSENGAHGIDPHVWLDPIRVRDVVAPAITRHLVQIDPRDEAGHQRRLADFTGRLTRLDAAVRGTLERAPGRRYVAFHNAWRYFAERYGLEEVAVVQEFAGEEPTPKEVVRLVREAREASVPAILVEPQLPDRIARTIAAEFGGATVIVDPLGDPGDPERSTYESLMRFNARAFARALGHQEQEEELFHE